jgi:hypothetical protein
MANLRTNNRNADLTESFSSLGAFIVKYGAKVALVLFFVAALIAGAQSSTGDRGGEQDTQARGYWTDPASKLMWAGKDNGKDVNWHNAMKYCRDLRLAGYSDWRLPTIEELQGIYDKNAFAPGLVGKDRNVSFAIKGNLFLTGDEWSSTQRTDDQGHPDGFAWYFDFDNGIRKDEDASRFSGRFADSFKRALCVRRSGE